MRWSLHDRVRRGQRVDAKAVLAIFLTALHEYGFVVTKGDVSREIATFGASPIPSRLDLVAVRGSEVCGFVVLTEPSQGCGEIAHLFVDARHRQRGLGTTLIDACIEEARNRGYRELMLETDTAFRDARRYYERHGWMLMPHFAGTTTRTYVKRLIGARPSITSVRQMHEMREIPEVSQTRIRINPERDGDRKVDAPQVASESLQRKAQRG